MSKTYRTSDGVKIRQGENGTQFIHPPKETKTGTKQVIYNYPNKEKREELKKKT